MIKILYLEDEESIAKIVKESLQGRSFEVMHLPDGDHVMEHYQNFNPDVCVFDVMLPVKDGFTIAREVRSINPSIPILFVTAKTQTNDVIEGFSAGGNDYIKKPFSLEELIVRINNLYKITNKDQINIQDEKVIKIGEYSYYSDKLELKYNNEIRRISYREGQLLTMLVENRNEIVVRKKILDTLWGDDNFFNSRNLDVYITKLRNYFKQDEKVQIITLKAVGYRLID